MEYAFSLAPLDPEPSFVGQAEVWAHLGVAMQPLGR